MDNQPKKRFITRWTLFILALPIGAFISLVGWFVSGYDGLLSCLALLLALPILLMAFYSFRLAAVALWLNLILEFLLWRHFDSLTWDGIAMPSLLDYGLGLIAILITAAAFLPPTSRQPVDVTPFAKIKSS